MHAARKTAAGAIEYPPFTAMVHALGGPDGKGTLFFGDPTVNSHVSASEVPKPGFC
jgi:hypothetical protein